ncbi:hypothetical protein DFJ77DRAFT_469029 [Powellomyces hirtus]|nr:hypothetical protein DFJ77DRAFT_469029 [Powellomyces hirtus]
MTSGGRKNDTHEIAPLTVENLALIVPSKEEKEIFIQEYVRQQRECIRVEKTPPPKPCVASSASSEKSAARTKSKKVLNMKSKDGSVLSKLLEKSGKRKLLVSPASAHSLRISPVRLRKRPKIPSSELAAPSHTAVESSSKLEVHDPLPERREHQTKGREARSDRSPLEEASRQEVDPIDSDTASSSSMRKQHTRSRKHCSEKALKKQKCGKVRDIPASEAKKVAKSEILRKGRKGKLASKVMESFKSKNVASGRITMNGNHRLGLFSKGMESKTMIVKKGSTATVQRCGTSLNVFEQVKKVDMRSVLVKESPFRTRRIIPESNSPETRTYRATSKPKLPLLFR